MRSENEDPPQARIPADVDTPDKVIYGLTAPQMAILAVAAAAGYGLYQAVGHLLPAPLLVAVVIPLAGATAVLALGRRDGLAMQMWLLSALRHIHGPKRLVPASAGSGQPVPGWAPPATPPVRVAALRLPAQAISQAGVIEVGARAVALVACSTVNIGLRTSAEQHALIGGYGRWLNSLTAPVQIVISTQRVDLASHAQRIAETAQSMPIPALAEAALDYAAFLDELAARTDPLCRTVTIAVTADRDHGGGTEVLRRAEHTATALAALGAQTRVLDGGRAAAVLTCAVDPYIPTDVTWPRARPDEAITGPGELP
ncbi:PrgI family protein [Phytohabitans houttuyneae]|uniref:PrgI family protein n=1 Tax=Phytohabitans houttuyneae TaxID=1076126 RepID=A0A6V8KI34_9ACTN|nr:PrgI family protein [Phytohabitans houttuyneae]GFJ82131.1 hypothetical protein Phou_063110 [Phytohabitans houttuyneae]